MFSHLRILYHFWIGPIPSYLNEPPCTQNTPSSCRCSQWEQINTTLWRNKNRYECMVWYNFWYFQGRPTNLHTLLKGGLRVHLGLIQWKQFNTIHCDEIKINMNVWLGITSREAYKCISKWMPMFSHLRILYHFWIWPIPSYLKEPPCTQSTPSSCRCSQWEQINTTLWRNKNDMNVWFDITSDSFQGRPTNVHPNESLCSPI